MIVNDVINAVKRRMLNDPHYTNEWIKEEINNALVDPLLLFEGIKSESIVDIIIGQIKYDFPVGAYRIDEIIYSDADTPSFPLVRKDLKYIVDKLEDDEDTPLYYFIDPYSMKIWVSPKPKKLGSIRVYYDISPPQISEDTDTIALPSVYKIPLIDYVAWKLKTPEGETIAKEYMQVFMASLNRLKTMLKHSTVSYIGEKYNERD